MSYKMSSYTVLTSSNFYLECSAFETYLHVEPFHFSLRSSLKLNCTLEKSLLSEIVIIALLKTASLLQECKSRKRCSETG